MSSVAPPPIVQDEKNPRGIPKALFIVRVSRALSLLIPNALLAPLQNDVEEYLGGPDAEVERVLNAFQNALAYVHCTRPHAHDT